MIRKRISTRGDWAQATPDKVVPKSTTMRVLRSAVPLVCVDSRFEDDSLLTRDCLTASAFRRGWGKVLSSAIEKTIFVDQVANLPGKLLKRRHLTLERDQSLNKVGAFPDSCVIP